MGTAGVHVVFGTGAIGLAVMDELLVRNLQVRMVNRSGNADVPADVEVVAGDASDAAFAVEVARGAAVVYQCLEPSLDRWVDEFPALQDAVVASARHNDAKLVVVEDLSMYGPVGGKHMTEGLSMEATTRKGRVRALMTTRLLEAHRHGDVRVAIGRASDYFGPRSGAKSQLGDRVVPAAIEGRKAQLIGNPDVPHTYSFLPDIGMGLVMLALDDRADGEVWHLPNPDTRTTRAVVQMMFEEAGNTPKITVTPRLALRAIGRLNPDVREMIEMLYEYEEPFIVSSVKFEDAFGLRGTKLREAVRRTVEWYRRRATD